MSYGERWEEAGTALSQIAEHALNFHTNAVEIRFFNHPKEYFEVKVRSSPSAVNLYSSITYAMTGEGRGGSYFQNRSPWR